MSVLFKKAYNATEKGQWINLLDDSKNLKHTGVIDMFSDNAKIEEFDFEDVHSFRISGKLDKNKAKIIINGNELPILYLFNLYQYQQDILDFRLYIGKLNEFKIYLPSSSYDCFITIFSKLGKLDNVFEPQKQYMAQVRNPHRWPIKVNILDKSEYSDILYSDIDRFTHITVYKNKREIVIKRKDNKGEIVLNTSLFMDAYQRSDEYISFCYPIDLREIESITVDVDSNSSPVFYLHNQMPISKPKILSETKEVEN